MLNQEWKEQFTLETDNSYAWKYFKLIADYETGIGKDLSSFSISEIISFYKSLQSSSHTFLINCNYSLILYTRWCLAKSLVPDGQNHYEEVDNYIIKDCLNYYNLNNSIISYDDLVIQENLLENMSDSCLVQAVFEGICGKGYSELSQLHINQINGDNLVLQDRSIKISSRLIGLMEAASEEYEGVSMAWEGGTPRALRFREDDSRVFKDCNRSRIDSEERRRIRIYRRIHRIQEYMGGSKAFTFGNLRKSGLIYTIKQLMEQDNTDAFDAIMNHRDEIENKYSKIPSVKQFVLIYDNFLRRDV